MVRPLFCVSGYFECGGTTGVTLSAVAVFILCHHKILFQFLYLPAKQIVKEHFVVISVFTHKYGSLNLIHIEAGLGKQRIGSCLACVYRVMDARGKFGEHERSVRVARGDSREQF